MLSKAHQIDPNILRCRLTKEKHAGYPRPEERQGHVMLRVSADCVLLFGGRGSSKGHGKGRRYLNDTWLLHLPPTEAKLDKEEEEEEEEFWWEQIECEGPVPSARWSCAATFHKSLGVILHGGRGDVFRNDMWRFDLEERSWSSLETKGDLPPTLNGHTIESGGTDQLFLFGGSSSYGRERQYNGRTYCLDLESLKWSLLSKGCGLCQKPLYPCPDPRYWHSSVSGVGVFYVFGGFIFDESNDEIYYNDLWRFDTTTLKWSQLEIDNAPIERNRCQLALVDEKTLLVHGGNYYGNGGDTFLGDVQLINLETGFVSKIPSAVDTEMLRVGHHALITTEDPMVFLTHGGEDGRRRFSGVRVLVLEEQ